MRHINCSSVLVAAILLVTSCASDSRTVDTSTTAAETNPSGITTAAAAAPSSTAAAAPISTAAPASTVAPTTADSQPPSESAQLPLGAEPFELDPTHFTTNIDNPYWPMQPGTRWTYREMDTDGTELQGVVVVTTQTKTMANGITARVVRDTLTRGGEIIEDTIDWYAQDSVGNVWYVGEDTAEFEGGAVASTAGSWQAGVDGALPGVIIPADPQPGLAYRQEYYAGQAEDNGAVVSLDETADVPYGHFDSLMMTADTSGIEPNVLEHKFYAKAVGPILTIDVGTAGREELLTVDVAPSNAGTGPLGGPNP
jgi:hypothetical protein